MVATLPDPNRRALDLSRLEPHTGFALRVVQQMVFDAFLRRFAAIGLTPARFSVLAVLAVNDDVPQGQLAEALETKPSNFAVLIAAMETEGQVERRTDPTNRRVMLLRLTSAGRALFERIEPEVLELDRSVLRRLDAVERKALRAALAKIRHP